MTQEADQQVVEQTLAWVRQFIVGHDICPFAKRELENDTIRVEVVRSKKLQVALEELAAELAWLDARLADVTPARFAELSKIFRDATRLEIDFWQMGLDLSE